MVRATRDTFLRYSGHGVQFDYPSDWQLQEEPTDSGGVMLMVAADDSCFWTLRVMPDRPAPDSVVESCVTGFREEYGEIDISDPDARLAEMPCAARDVEFSCFELLNTAVLRSVRCTDFTLLVWWQGTDHELQSLRGVLDSMTSSLRIGSLL